MFRRPPLQVREGLAADAQLLREDRLRDLRPPPSLRHAQTQLKRLQEPLSPPRYIGHVTVTYTTHR